MTAKSAGVAETKILLTGFNPFADLEVNPSELQLTNSSNVGTLPSRPERKIIEVRHGAGSAEVLRAKSDQRPGEVQPRSVIV